MLKGLYVIADTQSIRARDFLDTVESVLSVGTRIIQYRDKVNDQETRTVIGHKLRSLTRKHKSLLIINDDIELTRDIDADGVHLGKEDHGISETGTFLGAEKIIGASCYNEYGNAVQAVADGAAYIAFGSFFTSPTKPSAPLADTGLITRAKQELNIPVCAIGGITQDNVTPLLHAGADMIAVISGIFNSSSPVRSVQEYMTRLQPFRSAP
ncbi:MAG: thiamine phosphate synthase [Gammaproteobacteria bacterium]|nr:thiamine phosphate synthase [Gammaproteobacteria bacterium]